MYIRTDEVMRLNEIQEREEAFLKLKKVCSEEGLDKYKDISSGKLNMMVQILLVGHENVTVKDAYNWSEFGDEVIAIISQCQWKNTDSIRLELLGLAKERFLHALAEELGIIRLLDWIIKKLNNRKKSKR